MKKRKNKLSLILNLITTALFAGVHLFLAAGWSRFPEEIAGHYNFAGEIDRFSEKNSLLIYLFIIWILFVLLTVLERFPRFLGSKKMLDEGGTEKVLEQVREMLAAVKFLAIGILTYATVCSALARPLGFWFLPAILILTLLGILFFVIRTFQSISDLK